MFRTTKNSNSNASSRIRPASTRPCYQTMEKVNQQIEGLLETTTNSQLTLITLIRTTINNNLNRLDPNDKLAYLFKAKAHEALLSKAFEVRKQLRAAPTTTEKNHQALDDIVLALTWHLLLNLTIASKLIISIDTSTQPLIEAITPMTLEEYHNITTQIATNHAKYFQFYCSAQSLDLITEQDAAHKALEAEAENNIRTLHTHCPDDELITPEVPDENISQPSFFQPQRSASPCRLLSPSPTNAEEPLVSFSAKLSF